MSKCFNISSVLRRDRLFPISDFKNIDGLHIRPLRDEKQIGDPPKMRIPTSVFTREVARDLTLW